MSTIASEPIALCSTDDVWQGGALLALGFLQLAVFSRAEPCEVAMKVYPVQVIGGRVCIAKDPRVSSLEQSPTPGESS